MTTHFPDDHKPAPTVRLEYTAKGRYYHVTRDGTLASRHTTEREAAEMSGNLALRYPDSDVRYTHEYEVEVRVIGSLADQETGDTEAPTQPTGLVATAVNKNRIDLAWNASTDNIGVTGYTVYRDGVPIDTVEGAPPVTTYEDTGVSPSTFYSYTTDAFDAAGNNSGQSGAASATTPANSAPEWTAIPDQDVIVGNSYTLDLDDFTNDLDTDPLTYSIVSGTLPTGLSLAGSLVSGVPTTAGEGSAVTFRADDGNDTADLVVNYASFDADVTAPPVPGNLVASNLTATSVTMSWDAVVDAAGSANEFVSGTASYRLYRNGGLVIDQAGTSYNDTALSSETPYAFTVSSVDAEGNESAQSPATNITTASAGTLQTVRQTPEQIAVEIPDASSYSQSAYALFQYKLQSSSTWLDAHPLYRVSSPNSFAGVVFDLAPGQTYDLQATVVDGQDQSVFVTFATTRALPPAAGTPTATVSSLSAFETAINAASPGDVIQLQEGTYSGTVDITNGGTAANPIYVRGQNEVGTVINMTTSYCFDVDADNIVFENMTIDGQQSTNEVGARRPIRMANTGASSPVENITVRNMTIRNSSRAVAAAGGSSGFRTNNCNVYDCTLTGTIEWSATTIPSSTYWNNDGIRLVGFGNGVWNNTMQGYSDSITFAHSAEETSLENNYAYRNYIRNSLDNVFEFDHAIRFHGCYDNYCENINTGMSQSDNSAIDHIGPSYVFRNTFANVAKRWTKFNAFWEGWHHYNNTYLRSDSIAGDSLQGEGFYTGSPATQDRWAYRNNLHVWRNTTGNDLFRVRWTFSGADFDVSHNAWHPGNKQIVFGNVGPTSATLASAIADATTHDTLYPSGSGLLNNNRYHQFDVEVGSNPWATTVTMGSDALVEMTGAQIGALDAGSTAKNAGTPIPGITDGYSGAAPDIGANIDGITVAVGRRTQPTTGAPSWWTSAPSGNWFAVPTANTAEDVGMFRYQWLAFTGMGVDQQRLEYTHTCSGGHTNGSDNGVFALQLNQESPTWVRLVASSTNINGNDTGNSGDAAYPDGNPRSVHQWNAAGFPIGDTIWLPGMFGQYVNGSFGTQVWGLNRAAITNPPVSAANAPWTYYGNGINGDLQSARYEANSAAYDPDTGLIWVCCNNSPLGANPFYSVDTANGNITPYTSYGTRWPAPGSDTLRQGSSVIVEGHWIHLSGRADDIYIVDLSNPSSATTVTANVSGSPPNLNVCGAHYHAANRTIYVYKYNFGSTIYTLTVPSDVKNGQYSWGTLSNSTAPANDGDRSGEYSHFQYVQDMGDGQAGLLYCAQRNFQPYMRKLPTS